MDEKDIYSKIREARRARGLTVNELAKNMGEDHQKVGRIERGKRSLTIDYLMKVSKALDTPLEKFISEDQGEKSNRTEPANVLNKIILLVEENNSRLAKPLDAKNKANLISKAYELALKFPPAQQQLFLDSFLEGFFSMTQG
jgi:transcriptional regulator with XRE-family HTH domain